MEVLAFNTLLDTVEYEWGDVSENEINYKCQYYGEGATLNSKEFIAFADGSGTTTHKEAGIGVAIFNKLSPLRPLITIAEHIGKGSNNVAELMAVWRCLKVFPKLNSEITIYTDSEYAIGILTLDWKPKSNEDLVKCIRQDLFCRYRMGGTVTIKHVNGHSSVPGNELADSLAKWARKYGKNG